MAYLLKNNANSVLASSINSLVTSISVQTGHGDRFPVVASPDFTKVTLEDASGNREILKVTARPAASDTFTVERAQEGTTARSWAAGDVVELRFTAGTIQEILNGTNAHIADADDAHDASAISVMASGNLSSPNVQAALDELQTNLDEISAHLSDTDDAHDASAISYQGSTNLSATNVEAALDELDAEKINKSGDSLTGALNLKRSTVVATATNTPLWDLANGNVQDWTGTPTITDFPDAPQAGANRTIYPATGTILKDNANIAVQGNADYKIKSGDAVTITAITVSTFHALVHRKDGQPTISRVGEIFMWPLSTPPSYALVRNGAAVSRIVYADLFAVIGTTFGAGDGSTTFNLPSILSGHTDIAGFSNIGTVSTGEVKSHFHTFDRDARGGGGTGADTGNGPFSGVRNTSLTGGTHNLAAGPFQLPCICFR